MYIVVKTIAEDNDLDNSFDFWTVHDTLEEAEKEYEKVLKEEKLYTASITKVVKSTDY